MESTDASDAGLDDCCTRLCQAYVGPTTFTSCRAEIALGRAPSVHCEWRTERACSFE